jgi:hypothetical protein
MSLLRLITFRQQQEGLEPVSDTDAQAFLTAAGITDLTQRNAVNQLVIDLKSYSIWTKMKAVYPFVGGTATTHKYNLMDPRDLDVAYRLSFSGTWTHSSNGCLNSFSFADSFLNPSTEIALYDIHYSIYVRNTTNVGIDAGVTTSPVFQQEGWIASNYNNFSHGGFYDNDNGSGRIKVSSTGSQGFFVSSAIAANNIILQKNGTTIGTWTGSNTSSPGNTTITLGGVKNATGGAVLEKTAREYAFFSIGSGLDATEASNFYTAVQAYQTTLGRQV